MDYLDFKNKALMAANGFGLCVTLPLHIEWMTAEQKQRLRGGNFMTNERWQHRLLADRSKMVEISYGHGIGCDHMIGLTVFHRDDPEDDFRYSRAVFSIEEMTTALTEMDQSQC